MAKNPVGSRSPTVVAAANVRSTPKSNKVEVFGNPGQQSDEPTRLNGRTGLYDLACPDALGRDDIAAHIAAVIAELSPPFTTAVYGGWGEGKTHLMKSVELKLREMVTAKSSRQRRFETVWFDLWQHQNDVSPVAAMLQTARDGLLHNSDLGTQARTAIDNAINEVLVPLLYTALDVAPSSSVSLASGVVNAKVGAAKGLVTTYREFRDAQLQARMKVQEDQIQLRRLFSNALDALTPGHEKIVFFIDDLDRCLPEQVVDLLEKIRLFMNHDKCVFVIGVDEGAVVNAIDQVKQYKDKDIAAHYLEKMVQYAFDVPPIQKETRKAYLAQKLGIAVGKADRSRYAPPEGWDGVIDQIVTLWEPAFDDPEVNATVRLMLRTVNVFVVGNVIGASQLGARYDPRIMAVIAIIQACYREPFANLRRRHDDRIQSLWKHLFSWENPSEGKDHRDTDSLLGSVFCRTGERWAANGKREPDDELRLGVGFVQGVQGLWEATNAPVDVSFVSRVEAHFRLSDAVSSAQGPADRQTQDDTIDQESPDSGVSPSPPWLRGNLADLPPLPVKTMNRLTGLVDYLMRPPSAEWEVKSVCRQISGSQAAAGMVVELSGISWRVLDIDVDVDKLHGNKWALLLADRVIGTGPYNKAQVGMTWERCDLRRWLNGVFKYSLGEAFARRIVRVKVDNGPSPIWSDVDGGKETVDSFYLLSMSELATHLAGVESPDWPKLRNGLWKDDRFRAYDESGSRAWWWLRSPGHDADTAAGVSSGGNLRDGGDGVSASSGGVRPAFTLRLEP